MNKTDKYFKLSHRTSFLHNDVDAEVKQVVDEDLKHNLLQQSLLDAIRCFNIKNENAMNKTY